MWCGSCWRATTRCAVSCTLPAEREFWTKKEVDIHYGNVLNPDSLSLAMQGVDSVVNLVGVIRPRRGASFDQMHRQAALNVAEAARQAGAREIVHVSAMGATPDPRYPYLNTKFQGELAVKSSGPEFVILRPSIIFGRGDEFLTALAGLVRLGPIVPVIGDGRNRMQPVAVEDVAACIASSVGNSMVKGKVLNLGGPTRLSYNSLLDEVAAAMERKVRRVHVPMGMAAPAISVMLGILPRPPMTSGQLKMLSIRNVSRGDDIERFFGFTPRPLRGNIDFVNSVGLGDALSMTLGLSMPRRR